MVTPESRHVIGLDIDEGCFEHSDPWDHDDVETHR
jgi:hypothetical protein